jgi:hypothetical protein
MQGLGLANEAAWRSLINEVVEAHNTKNMIPHPKISDRFLIQGPTNRQESALAVARIIQADSINSAPRWQHFPHQEWLTDTLFEIAKRGFQNKQRKSKYLQERPRHPREKGQKKQTKKRCRSDHYSGYSQTSLQPGPNPQPTPQSASTKAQALFTTSHIPTASIVAAPSPLVNSASATSSYPLESPRLGPSPSPAQAQLLSATSKPPTDATPLHIPTSIFNLRRMILVARRVTISKAWTEPMSFFPTEEAKLSERYFSYDVFESALAQTSFLGYKDEENQVMFQHSKLGMITIESATALNDVWQKDGILNFSIRSRDATTLSQYSTLSMA